MKKLLLILTAIFAIEATIGTATISANTNGKAIRVFVTPDHQDWNYECGERPVFNVLVLKHHTPMQNVEISYIISEDKMPERKSGTLLLKEGYGKIKLGTMRDPGFLRCEVTVKDGDFTYSGYAAAGFEPQNIKPTVEMPEDFDLFWMNALRESAQIPLEPVLTLQPDQCTYHYNVYNVKFRNGAKDYFYGVMTVPTKPGKHPAVLQVPGANVRSYKIDKNLVDLKSVVTLIVGIHGIPIDMKGDVYDNLKYGALKDYNRINIQNRDKYYYKRVYIGCSRAVDVLASLDFVDASRIAVCGGSQGGALSFTTAYLNPKVKCLYAYYPALSDLTGYLHKRGGGWPNLFRRSSDDYLRNDNVMNTIKYYDVVNFARKIKVPAKVALGYNDRICCPTSMFSTYNSIPGEKSLLICNEIGHYTYAEMHHDRNKWLLERLK
ncbi:MAG: acetylxylan esterase [Alistipes sp.]|nr:acetylxylan esterase [Alistipes sp.]